MSAPDSSSPPDRDPDGSSGAGSPRWPATLARLGGLVVLALCAVSAVVGAIAQPAGATIGFTVVALVVIGPLLAIVVHQGGADRRSAAAAGALAAGAAVLVFLVVGGLIDVFGAASVALLPLVLAAAGVWVWTRRTGLAQRARGAADLGGARAQHWADPTTRSPDPDPRWAAPPQTVTSPTAPPCAGRSTAELCRAWRESYWLLTDLSPATAHRVVEVRALLLDELERRDPEGFGHWLESVPRAGADPGGHLDRRPRI